MHGARNTRYLTTRGRPTLTALEPPTEGEFTLALSSRVDRIPVGNSILDTEIINGSYPRKYSSPPAIAPLVSGRVSESSGIVYRTVVRPVCPIPNPYRSSQVHNLMRLESRVMVVRVAHRGNLCLDHRTLSAAVSFALRNAASESEPFQVSFRSRERRHSRSSHFPTTPLPTHLR